MFSSNLQASVISSLCAAGCIHLLEVTSWFAQGALNDVVVETTIGLYS